MIGLYIFIGMFSFLAICLLAIGFYILTIKKIVNTHSIAFKKIKEINNKYKFYDVKDIVIGKRYDSYNNFASVCCHDFLVYYLSKNKFDILNKYELIEENIRKYNRYKKEISKITTHSFDIEISRLISKKLLYNYEDQCIKNASKVYTFNKNIVVSLWYKFERKVNEFDEEYVLKIIKKLNNKRGNYYVDFDIFKSLETVERTNVSKDMRLRIYSRDNYQCLNCKSKDNLTIDHIVPISKGGKSTIDNLQTLCETCNKNKGNKIIDYRK